MNLVKRAYLHTIRKKGKTALMFGILLIISTLILTCLSIRTGTDTAARNIRESLMGGFTINAKNNDALLAEAAVKKILNIPGMRKNYNLRSYFYAQYRDTKGNPLKTANTGAPSSMDQESAAKIIGSSHSEESIHFKEKGFKLLEGRHIKASDHNVLLVSDVFAKLNHLKAGDELKLYDVESERNVSVKIIGIFKAVKSEAESLTAREELGNNIAFCDDRLYSKLAFNGGWHYQYADFYVEDPKDLDTIIFHVKQIAGMDWQKCTFTKNDADYLHAKEELASLQNLVMSIVSILIVISACLLALILFLWIRYRMHEIGMMSAMGISKKSMILQHIVEVMMIAAAAFALSYVTSSFAAQRVSDTLVQQKNNEDKVHARNLSKGTEKEKNSDTGPVLEPIDIQITGSDIVQVYVIGTAMILLSVTIASISILRKKPKEILTKMN